MLSGLSCHRKLGIHVPRSSQFLKPGVDVEVAPKMCFDLKAWSFPVEPDKETATLRDFHIATTSDPF